MRIPSFSRQSSTDTAHDDRSTVAGGSTVAPPDDETTTRFDSPGAAADPRAADPRAGDARADRPEARADYRAANVKPDPRANRAEVRADHADETADRTMTTQGRAEVADRVPDTTRDSDRVHERQAIGPKPRASFLATLGLILSVAAALLVLSGPLLGYGIGVAVLALILSLSGIHATGRRHVAGKTDALIGMVLSLAAIVVGVLALTGSLSWLGTDVQPVNGVREWLDAQIVNRF